MTTLEQNNIRQAMQKATKMWIRAQVAAGKNEAQIKEAYATDETKEYITETSKNFK